MRDVVASARFYGWLLNAWPREWTHRYATVIRQDLEQNVVLVEVPVMLSLVWFANRTTHWFAAEETAIRAPKAQKTT